MKKTILLVMLLFPLQQSHAALVDNGWFTTDTLQELDWLDLSITGGMPVSDALAASPGWRLATNLEVESLFYRLFPNDYVESSDGIVRSTDNPGLPTEIANYMDLFGVVHRFDRIFRGQPNGYSLYTAGKYYDENNILRAMGAYQEVDRQDDLGVVYTVNHGYRYEDRDDLVTQGTYLVRSSIIPVPAAVWLFGSALAGLGWMRGKQSA